MKKLISIYKKWVDIGLKIANVQVRFVFAAAYIVFIVPFGILFRMFSDKKKPGWHDAPDEPVTLESAKKQY